MKALVIKINDMIEPLRGIANKFASPLLDLGFRLYVAEDFFRSGLGRFNNYLDGNWDTQLFLFEMEHPVAGLDAALVAPMTTAAELILPVLLALGLFTRFGAAGIFVMALVIQMTYLENFQHILWMTLMLSVFIKGPGVISLDFLMQKRLKKCKDEICQA